MKICTLASNMLALVSDRMSSGLTYLTVQSTSDVEGGRPKILLNGEQQMSAYVTMEASVNKGNYSGLPDELVDDAQTLPDTISY